MYLGPLGSLLCVGDVALLGSVYWDEHGLASEFRWFKLSPFVVIAEYTEYICLLSYNLTYTAKCKSDTKTYLDIWPA